MLKKIILWIIPITFIFSACTNQQTADPLDVNLERTILRLSSYQSLEDLQVPDRHDLAKIPAGIGNPLTTEKVALGKMLFFETGLARDAKHESGMGTYSCSTCHVTTAAWMPGGIQGIADGAWGFGYNGESRTVNSSNYTEDQLDAQGARPLSMIGVAYVTNSMWSGHFGARFQNEGTEELWGLYNPITEINHTGLDGIEAQNIEGSHLHRMLVDGYVLDTLGYREMFDAAFYDWPINARYGREALSFALSAFIRTILPYNAPYQKWLRGDKTAMTDQQKRGATLFFGDAGCHRCHHGPSLGNNDYQAVGVNDLCDVGGLNTHADDPRNLGRGGFTNKEEDMFAFKIPQLYNLKDSPFYFHGSSHYSLRDVVQYFNDGVHENERVPLERISSFFHALNMTDAEMEDLTEFLAEGLHDPSLRAYHPDFVLSGNCFPNNDPISQQQLGCE